MSVITVSKRIADVEMNDTVRWYNDTGSDVANNQLVFVNGDTGYGFVGVAVGQQPVAAGDAANVIPAAGWGTIIVKGRFELPCGAAGFTQGLMAMASSGGAAYVTAGGLAYTTSGYRGIGLITKLSAVGNPTTASFCEVDLNVGPKAFIVN
jgi:hypothetical protein